MFLRSLRRQGPIPDPLGPSGKWIPAFAFAGNQIYDGRAGGRRKAQNATTPQTYETIDSVKASR